MDFSICKALSYNMKDIPVALLMYDIMCQYRVNFKKRIRKVQSSAFLVCWSSERVSDYFTFTVIKTLAYPDTHLALFPEQNRLTGR
jgi:hypothetical protein